VSPHGGTATVPVSRTRAGITAVWGTVGPGVDRAWAHAVGSTMRPTLRTILLRTALVVVSGALGCSSSDGASDSDARSLETTLRGDAKSRAHYTIVLVPAGATFSGWSSYPH
jgi:hypothetical protein